MSSLSRVNESVNGNAVYLGDAVEIRPTISSSAGEDFHSPSYPAPAPSPIQSTRVTVIEPPVIDSNKPITVSLNSTPLPVASKSASIADKAADGKPQDDAIGYHDIAILVGAVALPIILAVVVALAGHWGFAAALLAIAVVEIAIFAYAAYRRSLPPIEAVDFHKFNNTSIRLPSLDGANSGLHRDVSDLEDEAKPHNNGATLSAAAVFSDIAAHYGRPPAHEISPQTLHSSTPIEDVEQLENDQQDIAFISFDTSKITDHSLPLSNSTLPEGSDSDEDDNLATANDGVTPSPAVAHGRLAANPDIMIAATQID